MNVTLNFSTTFSPSAVRGQQTPTCLSMGLEQGAKPTRTGEFC